MYCEKKFKLIAGGVCMEQREYFVNMTTNEISDEPHAESYSFKIIATSEDVLQLKAIMDNIHTADVGSLARASIPFKPYHEHKSMDLHDESYMAAYQMIYRLGNDETKTEIEKMGILGEDFKL